jgi:hypothetical protein
MKREFAEESNRRSLVRDRVEPPENLRPDRQPIDVVIHCPACGLQHVDAPAPGNGWSNPPHRSHLCAGCGTVWRPADVPTNGVAAVQTRGKADTWSPGAHTTRGAPGVACYTRAQFAAAVDEAHHHAHRAQDVGADGGLDADERLLLVLGHIQALHDALHNVGAGMPRVDCATHDPEAQAALRDALAHREREIPCGHRVADLIGGTNPATGRPLVTKCGACLAAQPPHPQAPDLDAAEKLARGAKTRADAATPGPWKHTPGVMYKHYCHSTDGRNDFGFSLQVMHWKDGHEVPAEANCVFVAHARADVPLLANHVLALAAEVRRLRSGETRLLEGLKGESERVGQLEERLAAFAGLTPLKTFPDGTTGARGWVLAENDRETAILVFEPGGVLGEEAHDYEERLSLVRGSIDVSAVSSHYLFPPGKRHRITAGPAGAVVVAWDSA